ncbi:DUF4233 domain-containing protein [Pengzhenrongella sicca]|nr:DUF4233 domain-containing protein [Pengzhenrongella sicca]
MSTAASSAPTARRRSARHTFAATMLVLEAFAVFFATLVVFALQMAPAAVVWAVGGALAVTLVLASGLLRRPGGYVAGSVVQAVVLAASIALFGAPIDDAAFVAGTTLVVALVFVGLWVAALRLGGRIDRERAEWDAAHPAG